MEFNPDLHQILMDYETQMFIEGKGELQVIVFIPFRNLEDFTKTLCPSDFDEGGISASLVHGSVCIELRDLFENNGYKLKHYKNCFAEEDFNYYESFIKVFDGED